MSRYFLKTKQIKILKNELEEKTLLSKAVQCYNARLGMKNAYRDILLKTVHLDLTDKTQIGRMGNRVRACVEVCDSADP